MPFRRRYKKFVTRKRGRRSSNRPWYSKKYSIAGLASKALRGVWKLKGLVNSEMFKYDVAFSSTAISTAPVTNVCAIAQGDGDGARTGNSIFARAFNLSGALRWNPSGSNIQMVRVSVIMDTQQISDGLPTYTDIYESSSPYAHLNSNTVGRYKVLFSRMYIVNNSDRTGCAIKINLPMRHHVRYNGSATTDIQKGGLYLCVVSDEPTANVPTWQGEYRLSYHDN